LAWLLTGLPRDTDADGVWLELFGWQPQPTMGSDGVAWLLASTDPSVRYLALTQVIGESPRSRQVRAAYEGISTGPRVSALLRGLMGHESEG
jgi:hypothetical protein